MVCDPDTDRQGICSLCLDTEEYQPVFYCQLTAGSVLNIKPELVIFALVFSVLIGLVSGYQPANKAVKISALEAIRNE